MGEITDLARQMKFQWVVILSSLSVSGLLVAATPETIGESGVQPPAKSIAEWVRDLADEQFKVREEATRKIWELGDTALPELQQAASGRDPETAYRARELVRKIELHLTPQTDPEVMKLVERYAGSSTDEKQNLIEQMLRKRAWRQILKLFASDTNAELRKRVRGTITEVAVIAARECIVKSDPTTAREYLEMAPADAAGLLALADFHRSQGTLDAELARAKTLKGDRANAWQLALYRAAGNIEAARDAATAAGEGRISAAMSVLLGDPVPWLRMNSASSDGVAIHKPYTELAIKRWQGKKLTATDLEPLVRALTSRSKNDRRVAINSLFLLGESQLAEEAFIKSSGIEAFLHFDALERIPEALKALGLDPVKPDYTAWVAERLDSISEDEPEDGPRASTQSSDLLLMASFMDRRGMNEEFRAAFMKPLIALAEKEEESFAEFLGLMFGNGVTFTGAPDMAKQVVAAWAGEDADRWSDVLDLAFGEDEEIAVVWDWMGDLDSKLSLIERFDGLLAIQGKGTDPQNLRDKWLALGWAAIDKAPEDRRKSQLEKMARVVGMNPDVVSNLKLWDLFPEDERAGFFSGSRISELTISGRWDEAAEFFLRQIERVEKLKLDPDPSTHACAAACLRKAGRLQEAKVHDEWVEKLALGNDAYKIAVGYQYGDDFTRAAGWFERAARQDDPKMGGIYTFALEELGDRQLEQGRWRLAAALFEVKTQLEATVASSGGTMVYKLKLRLQSDLGRALADLKSDRAASLALLENCYQMFPGDCTLADYFFPSLRQEGLTKEHDAWFKTSWERMSEVAKAYPGSSNTLNTTGWLAAKAQRNLDQAEELLEHALAIKPNEPSYLDTMAEIQFGKGDRVKALKWSARAVNFTPGGESAYAEGDFRESFMLRRQHEHFRNDPLPK